MKREEIISFNLSDPYKAFLTALEAEFAKYLLIEGQVKPSLTTSIGFLTFDDKESLAGQEMYDYIEFNLKNHASYLWLEIYPLKEMAIEIIFRDLDDKNYYALPVSRNDLFNKKEIVQACLLWLNEREATPWLAENAKEADHDFVKNNKSAQ